MRRKLEWDGRYETAYGNSLLVMPVGQPDASGTGGRRTADRNLYQNTGLRKEQETQPQTVPQQTTEKTPARGIPLWLPITAGICLLLAVALLVTRRHWS